MSAEDRARAAELAARLASVQARIAAACTRAGRRPEELTLVVVTKFFPVRDVELLADLGVSDFGESRAQEAKLKAQALAARNLTWHFVGQVQRNKAAAVAHHMQVIHALDRPSLIDPLGRAAADAAQPLAVLVQVNLDPEPHAATVGPASAPGQRAGTAPEQVSQLASLVAENPHLRLRGVMAVAPRGGAPHVAFERLATVASTLRLEYPQADWISAGMSGDLEDAVNCGATHLRIGSAILGSRPVVG